MRYATVDLERPLAELTDLLYDAHRHYRLGKITTSYDRVASRLSVVLRAPNESDIFYDSANGFSLRNNNSGELVSFSIPCLLPYGVQRLADILLNIAIKGGEEGTDFIKRLTRRMPIDINLHALTFKV